MLHTANEISNSEHSDTNINNNPDNNNEKDTEEPTLVNGENFENTNDFCQNNPETNETPAEQREVENLEAENIEQNAEATDGEKADSEAEQILPQIDDPDNSR